VKNITIKNKWAYEELFSGALKSQSPLVVWANNSQGERQILSLVVTHFSSDDSISLTDFRAQVIPFTSNQVYAYSENHGFIFKASIVDQNEQILRLALPPIVKILEEDEVFFIKGSGIDDYSLAPWRVKKIDTSEEEEVFSGQREAPRVKPKEDKLITCHIAGKKELSKDFIMADMSRGGMGFMIPDESLFKVGDFIELTAIEMEQLEKILIGEVMSVRSMGSEGWKVGVRFIDKLPAKT
jgi:hypothetical protein